MFDNVPWDRVYPGLVALAFGAFAAVLGGCQLYVALGERSK